MDLSWPHSPGVRVNACTPKYMGACKLMTLPTASDHISLIKEAGKGCYLYLCDISRTYRQVSLDPCDWPYMYLKVQGCYIVDMSFPFGLRWAASCCHNTTSFINRAFKDHGGMVPNYIHDFGGVALGENTTTQHFNMLCSLTSVSQCQGGYT